MCWDLAKISIGLISFVITVLIERKFSGRIAPQLKEL